MTKKYLNMRYYRHISVCFPALKRNTNYGSLREVVRAVSNIYAKHFTEHFIHKCFLIELNNLP